jgi:serine/threonine protein kinase
MSLTIGQILQERYRIDGLLAESGRGATYRAFDETAGTPVAIKENVETTPEAQEQFRRDAELLHRLRHPNLPQVTDHFVVADQGQYLVMDHVEGEDLSQILVRQKVVPESQALGWIHPVLGALEYLHSQEVVHQDVKPANIKITPAGQVFLVDLGPVEAGELQERAKGAPSATPGFSAPEQYGEERADARSDVYSAGATLYALLTGQAPPDAMELVADPSQLPPPRQLNPEISEEAAAAILQAMRLPATDRFQSAAELAAALPRPQPALDALAQQESIPSTPDTQGQEESVPSAPPGRPEPASLLTSHRAWLWVAGALLVVLILILVVWQPLAPTPGPTDSGTAPTAMLTAEDHFRQGNEFIQAGELEKAVEEYKKALEIDADNVDVLTNLGVVYYNLGQLDEAVLYYSRAIESAPGDADIHSNLAAAYVQMNQLDRALDEYLTAMDLNPDLAEAAFGLGVVYLQQGEVEKAIQAFEKFQELDTGRDSMASAQAEQYLQQLKGE